MQSVLLQIAGRDRVTRLTEATIDDEDIPTITPTEDAPTVARKSQSNEIRIGPITRARAKLLEQQVNLLLNESGTLIDENFILPKSMHLCMIRFVGEAWREEEKGYKRSPA